MSKRNNILPYTDNTDRKHFLEEQNDEDINTLHTKTKILKTVAIEISQLLQWDNQMLGGMIVEADESLSKLHYSHGHLKKISNEATCRSELKNYCKTIAIGIAAVVGLVFFYEYYLNDLIGDFSDMSSNDFGN